MNLFGSRYHYRKSALQKDSMPYYNLSKYKQGDVFFIFENLHLYNIKHILNKMNINISGGSLTQRHLWSFTQVNLFKILTLLKFTFDDMLKLTEKSKFRKNLYREIQYKIQSYSDKLIRELVFQTIEELLGTSTELAILLKFLEIEIKNLNNQASSSNGPLTTTRLSPSTTLNPPKNSIESIEDKIKQYQIMESDLNSINIIYVKYIYYIGEYWESLVAKNKAYKSDLRDSEPTSYFAAEQMVSFEFEPFLKLLISLYSCLYERRQNLIFNNNYYNYIKLIIDQKLPSAQGPGFDVRKIFES